MNLRHAAALGLVGWYLMSPPIGDDFRPQLSAPLYDWDGQWDEEADKAVDPFLTLGECEARKAANKRGFLDEAKKADDPKLRALWLRFSRDAVYDQCVRSDDPRLEDPLVRKLLK